VCVHDDLLLFSLAPLQVRSVFVNRKLVGCVCMCTCVCARVCVRAYACACACVFVCMNNDLLFFGLNQLQVRSVFVKRGLTRCVFECVRVSVCVCLPADLLLVGLVQLQVRCVCVQRTGGEGRLCVCVRVSVCLWGGCREGREREPERETERVCVYTYIHA